MEVADNPGNGPVKIIRLEGAAPDGGPVDLEEVSPGGVQAAVTTEVVLSSNGDVLEEPGLNPMDQQASNDVVTTEEAGGTKYAYYSDTKDMAKARVESVRNMLTGMTGKGQGLHKLQLLPGQVRKY